MNDDFFDNLRHTLTDTAEVVGKKTEDLVEIQKLRSRIRNARRSIEVDYKKLGEMIYQRYIEGKELDAELTPLCELIMELQKQVAAQKEELASRRGQIICPSCGSSSPRDAAFCMHCGAVIPKPEPKEEDPYAAGPVSEDEDEGVAAEDDVEEKLDSEEKSDSEEKLEEETDEKSE